MRENIAKLARQLLRIGRKVVELPGVLISNRLAHEIVDCDKLFNIWPDADMIANFISDVARMLHLSGLEIATGARQKPQADMGH